MKDFSTYTHLYILNVKLFVYPSHVPSAGYDVLTTPTPALVPQGKSSNKRRSRETTTRDIYIYPPNPKANPIVPRVYIGSELQ
jgi:hypothetical protein